MTIAPPLPCPECGAPLVLKHGMHGSFFGCSQFRFTGCSGTHSAHQSGKYVGQPMGTPATADVKLARTRAHREFDQIWITGRMTRSKAYVWLQKVLQLTKRDAHIAKMDLAQCEQLLSEIQRLGKKRPT